MNPAEIVAARRATLARLQPVKLEARERSRELYDKRREMKGQATERAEVRELVENHPLDLFPTPPALAARMVELATREREVESYFLEPSAGTGNIAQAIRAAGFHCNCIELNHSAAEYLLNHGFPTIQADWLTYEDRADTIIMNPPFSNCQDIDYVNHAWAMLNPGGRLVAIMSAGAMYRSDKKTVAFREWLKYTDAVIEDLPAGTFATSGTNVSSILLVVNKDL
jgi:predicted RNA methylase